MQTRPFLQRLFPFFKKSKLESLPSKTSHTFPLSPPTDNVGPRDRIVGRYRRVRIPWNPPVTDPRFNHSLRPSHIARAKASITTVEKLPDSCLPSDHILSQLGYEKID